MAGEVINMFGSGGKGPFGTNGMSGGMENPVETEEEQVNPGPGGPPPGPDPQPAGDSQPDMLPAAAILKELDIALGHARHAAHRLVDLVSPASMPEEQFEQLHMTYSTVQNNLGVVAGQAREADSQDALMAVNRNARDVVTQVQQYVEAVESAVGQLGTQPGSQLAPRKGGGNGMLWLALAMGTAAAGYGLWQINKRKGKKK